MYFSQKKAEPVGADSYYGPGCLFILQFRTCCFPNARPSDF